MTSNTGKSTSYQFMEKSSIRDRRYTMKSFAHNNCEFHDESTSATSESIVIINSDSLIASKLQLCL